MLLLWQENQNIDHSLSNMVMDAIAARDVDVGHQGTPTLIRTINLPHLKRCFGVASLLPPQDPSGTADGTTGGTCPELGHGLKFQPSALR